MMTPTMYPDDAPPFETEAGAPEPGRQPRRPRLIPRRRWSRILAILLAGLILITQAPAASAASQSNLAYQLGKEGASYLVEIEGNDLPSRRSSDGGGVSLDRAAPFGSRSGSLGGGGLKSLAAPLATPAAEPGQAESGEPASGPALTLEDDFTSAQNTALWTGVDANGEAFIDETAGGWYVMAASPGTHFATDAPYGVEMADAIIVVDATFYGEGVGMAGVSARATSDGEYYCGIDVYDAVCWVRYGGEWYELFRLADGEFPRYEVDRMVLEVIGSGLIFTVNDTIVGVIDDADLGQGVWGIATGCYEGECYGLYDYIAVYDYAGGQASGDGGELQTEVVLADDFSQGPAGYLYTGEGEWGRAAVVDGVYLTEMAPGWYFPNNLAGTEQVADGIMTADVVIAGSGAFGLVGRFSTSAEGLASYDVCWLMGDGTAGCNVVVDDVWHEIEGGTGRAAVRQGVNSLTLAVTGDQIIFAVNGEIAVSAVEDTLPAGGWGFYSEAFAGSQGFGAYIDGFVLEQVLGEAQAAHDFEVAVSTDFLANDYGFYTGSGEWGAVEIFDGWYITDLAPGMNFANTLAGTGAVASGLLTVDVGFEGQGSTGLVGRYQLTESGESYYVCWLRSDAYAGCHVVVDDQWYSLGVTEQPLAVEGIIQLSLAIDGSQIIFAVNGEIILEIDDSTLASGDWGLFTESFSDGQGFTSYVDFLTLQKYASYATI